MATIRRLRFSAGRVAKHLLFITRRVFACINKNRGHIRRQNAPIEAKTCPEIHFQSHTGSWVIDSHVIKPHSATSVAVAETFPLFPMLPPELRLKIWHYASSASRVVELLAIHRDHGFRPSAAPRPPAVLHACHESREVARRIYKPWFWWEAEGRPKKPIHINPVNDVVFIRSSARTPTAVNWDWVVGPASTWRRQLRKLHRVAFVLGHNPMDLSYVTDWFCMRTTGQFRSLRELILLWVLDGAARTILGRGANVIREELDSLCHNCKCSDEARRAAEHSRDTIMAIWTANGVWERLGREPPVITIMHWCSRDVTAP